MHSRQMQHDRSPKPVRRFRQLANANRASIYRGCVHLRRSYMDYRFSSWSLGAIIGLLLWCTPPTAAAEDLCAPSEATDPQPQHINGSKTFTYKTIGDVNL